MSIADKLTYLNETKSLLREAINAAGGNLTQETPFREYVGGWLRDQSASLILDFSKQQYVAKDKVSMFPDRVGFEDIVTFTRSTGGGRFNAQGEYEWLGPDEPRIDYDPLAGECLGLLVEEQRTNTLPNSLSPALWTATSQGITYDASEVHDFFGTGSAIGVFRETEGLTSSMHVGRIFGTIGSEVTSTVSVFIKDAGVRYVSFGSEATDAAGVAVIDLLTGELKTESGYTVQVSAIGSGWFRVSATINISSYNYRRPTIRSASNYAGEAIRRASDTVVGSSQRGFLLAGIQSEVGGLSTSLIPTEGAQVTRSADIATVNDLAPWYSPNQGGFSIKAEGHVGAPLLTAGDTFIIADSDELKEYQVSYSEDPQATQVDIGKGLIESIRYWPRETA